MSYRGARGMAFVRGESSDTAVKGDKYMWASAPDTQSEKMRGLKREADDDAYFDDDDEKAALLALLKEQGGTVFDDVGGDTALRRLTN